MSENFIDNNKFFKIRDTLKSLFEQWDLSIEEVDFVVQWFERDVRNARQNLTIKNQLSKLKLPQGENAED